MPRPKKRQPSREFNAYPEFIRFILDANKKMDRDEGGAVESKIFFTDGSWAVIDHTESSVSDNGTGWPEILTIRYFEPA